MSKFVMDNTSSTANCGPVLSVEHRGEVVIVEDNKENLRLLSRILFEVGYKVIPISNGRDALDLLESLEPDCILLDIKMEGMDGYEVCKHLKSNKKTECIPVLFISGMVSVTDKLKGFEVGGDDFVSKPFLQEEILARVHTHITLFQKNRAKRLERVEKADTLKKAMNALNDTKKGRQLLEEELSRFYEAVLQADEAIVITDRKGDIWFVNPAFERITGYERRSVLGKNPRVLKSGQHDKQFYRAMWQTLLRGETWKGELVNRKKDGSHYIEKATISPVHDQDGSIVNFIAVKEDITKQRELEEQLHHSQKMETIGRLAGGVAHDYNNMLSVILGRTQMLLNGKQLDDDVFKSLEQIQKAAHRAAETTRRMLSFSRKQIIAPEVLDLNLLVDDLITMVRRLLGEDIDIEFVLIDDLCKILIDPDQLRHIIMNLCLNARDAMPDGGKIIFETRIVTFDEAYCTSHTGYKPGKYVLLSVSDTGMGIEADVLPSIFEPFFTTKEEGKGTGMGLASVYGAIKRCDGFIQVHSESGQGAQFDLYFPSCQDNVESDALEEESVSDDHSYTLLLVEDNDLVRDLTKTMLQALGHTVLVAEEPVQALQIVEQKGKHIDMLLTDVIMPGMSGKKLHQAVKEIYPQIKTLFMSGYTSDVIAQHGILDSGIHFIQKPFGMEDLSRKILEAASS